MHRSTLVSAGLVLSGVLALGDLATVVTTDGEHPPMAIAAIGALLGLVTIAGAVQAARGGSRGWIVAVVVTRLLSAVAAVPALLVPGVPSGLRAVAGAGIVLTLIAVALVAPALRRPLPLPA